MQVFNCNQSCHDCLMGIRSKAKHWLTEEVSLNCKVDMDEVVTEMSGMDTFSVGLTDQKSVGKQCEKEAACHKHPDKRPHWIVWVDSTGRAWIFHMLQRQLFNDRGIQTGWSRFVYRAELCDANARVGNQKATVNMP